MSEYVADEVCAERHKVVDERFSRDKQDIEDMKHSLEDKDERQRKIEQLTVEMGQMLKNHDRLRSKVSPAGFWTRFKALLSGRWLPDWLPRY